MATDPATTSIQELVKTSPYPAERPRRSLLVEGLLRASALLSSPPLVTPHLHGGSDAEKVQYEYDSEKEESFWDIVGQRVPANVLEGKDVLDIGCGWGGKAIWYAETAGLNTITGFDLPGVFDPAVPEAFARERGLDNCSFGTGLAEEIPHPDEQFDVAIMEDVMEHVRDPRAVLQESWRVLRPGGLLAARFPSIRMLTAHHFDRALKVPGIHYALSMRRLAAGLNHHLLQDSRAVDYEPFSEVAPTEFHAGVPRDLNGMDFAAFGGVVAESRFEVVSLDLDAFPPTKFGSRRMAAAAYRRLWRLGPLREPLSRSIVFVGRK